MLLISANICYHAPSLSLGHVNSFGAAAAAITTMSSAEEGLRHIGLSRNKQVVVFKIRKRQKFEGRQLILDHDDRGP